MNNLILKETTLKNINLFFSLYVSPPFFHGFEMWNLNRISKIDSYEKGTKKSQFILFSKVLNQNEI